MAELEKFGCRRPLSIEEELAGSEPADETVTARAESSEQVHETEQTLAQEDEPREDLVDVEDSDEEYNQFVVPEEEELFQMLDAIPTTPARPFTLSTARMSGTAWLSRQQGLPTVCAPMQTPDDAMLFDRLYDAAKTRRGGVDFVKLARLFNEEVRASIARSDGRQIYCKTVADLKDYVKELKKRKKADKALETIAPELRRLRKALRDNGPDSDLNLQFLTEEGDRPARRVSRSQRRKRHRQNATRERVDAGARDDQDAARSRAQGASMEVEGGAIATQPATLSDSNSTEHSNDSF